MNGFHRLALPLALLALPLALLALVWPASAAEAATIKAKTSVTTKSGATRIVAKLSSKNRLGPRKRPRKVRVKGGGHTYRLKRVRGGASAARVSLGTWRSAAYRGSEAQEVLDLVGERLKVVVKSRAGTTTLRSRLRAPAGSDPPPDDGQPPPDDGDPPPDDSQPGDITGQEAIDRMTAEIRDGAVRRFQTHDTYSETFELHLCGDGRFRWYHHQSDGPFVLEKFGQPWTVVEARIKADGSYRGARIQGTFTYQRGLNSGEQAINEPAEALIEFENGQWYWDKQPVETDTASCDPSF